MKYNDGIIWIDDHSIQLMGIDDVTVSFADEENPTLVDRILRMVMQGTVTNITRKKGSDVR